MSKKNKGSSAKKSKPKKSARPAGGAAKPVKAKKAAKPAKKGGSVKSSASKNSKKTIKAGTKKIAKPAKKSVKPVKAAKAVKKSEKVKSKPVAIKKTVPAKETKLVKPEVKITKTETIQIKQPVESKPTGLDVLAISNTIPKTEVKPLSASKIASISSSITNPLKKVDSYSVRVEKEPSGKFELEFVVRSSPEMLFEFLSTPSGLSEWFCDDVNIRNGIYTFIWDGQLQQARLLKLIDDQIVRFQWVDKTDGSYFEFKIQKDDLTNDTSLLITDFAETNGERESSKRLWTSQVEKLLHIIGSIF